MNRLNEIKQYALSHNIPIIRDKSAEKLISELRKNSPKNVLEIGTAIGYSTSLILNNCKGYVTTIEIKKDLIDIANKNLEDQNLINRVSLYNNDALNVLKELTQNKEKFDFIFLDGPKGQYIKYLPYLQRLLETNGTIFADNVLFKGLVNSEEFIPHKNRTIVVNLRKYLEQVSKPPFKSQVIDIEDGLCISKYLGTSLELLAPAGNMEKLKTAFYYGADAVYLAGKQFGLRAFSDNFDLAELKVAVNYAHELHKKVYVTLNILAHNSDFNGLIDYLTYLNDIRVDGVIVSDIGIMEYVKKYAPNLPIHISTQANITNKYSAKFFCDNVASRLILARELSIDEIKEICAYIPRNVEVECFVHGAMCISYSGRCLLSNYLTGRDSNRGACVQACRWEYSITERSRKEKCEKCGEKADEYQIQEDNRGTYILNSKDLNMIEHLDKLKNAGVSSFKIEGRMKSPYYVATVVNAYRRAIDLLDKNKPVTKTLLKELNKASHRRYTTAFYLGESGEYIESSMPVQTHEFMAIVVEDACKDWVKVEMRNRFKVGDTLEVLSPNDTFNKMLPIIQMKDEKGNDITDASLVQQQLYIKTTLNLKAGDILRKKI